MESQGESYNHIRRVEALEHTTIQVGQTLENIMHALADMRRESNANIERLEKRVIERENDSRERRNNLRERERRRGGRIEYGAQVVER